MDTKKVIENLASVEANKVYKSCKIRNVTVTASEDGDTRLSFTLDKPVVAMVAKEDGTYVAGESTVVFPGNYSVIGALRNNDDCSFACNYLNQHPKALGVILSGAKVDIIQEAVAEGQEYTNPFSTNGNVSIVAHDSYYTHAVNFVLSEFGIKKLDLLADKLLFGDL